MFRNLIRPTRTTVVAVSFLAIGLPYMPYEYGLSSCQADQNKEAFEVVTRLKRGLDKKNLVPHLKSLSDKSTLSISSIHNGLSDYRFGDEGLPLARGKFLNHTIQYYEYLLDLELLY